MFEGFHSDGFYVCLNMDIAHVVTRMSKTTLYGMGTKICHIFYFSKILAARYSSHFNRQVDPNSEVAVTVGCSQALYLALTALLQPQDEVLLIEPFFDLYLGQV